mmetsp:Transcript_12977/g.20108  ORF Transcript_12977/g.20108 Transcript_12977/m.20108 type:complete len:89 (+) Transcript_12977:589-855(+)
MQEEEKTREISLLKNINEGIGEMSDFDDHFENCQLADFDYFKGNASHSVEDFAEVEYQPTTMTQVQGILDDLELEDENCGVLTLELVP